MKSEIDEIDKEFNSNLSNVFEINENELDIEEYPSTVRDNNINNKLINLSGISILKDLEDKWDLIERKKYQNEDLLMKENKEEKERKKKRNMILLNSIKKAKEDFLKKLRKLNDDYDNDDFEDFTFEIFKRMQTYKDEYLELNNNKNNINENQKDQRIKNNQINPIEYNYIPNNKILRNKPKSFLKKDPYSEIYSNSFNNNISKTESNKSQKTYNNKISSSLIGKMKNIYDDIMLPSYTTYTKNILFKVKDDISEIKKKDSNNFNENNNSIEAYNQKNNLYSLERNFDNIYNQINPKKQRFINNKIIGKLDINNQNLNNEDLNNKNDLFNEFNKKSNLIKKNHSYKNLELKNDDIYFIKDDLKDKKLFKKIEENIKLLNRLVRINSKSKFEDNNFYNNSYMRNNKIELNSSLSSNKYNKNNSKYYNKVYSKNKFDSTSQILKKNSFELKKFFDKNPC